MKGAREMRVQMWRIIYFGVYNSMHAPLCQISSMHLFAGSTCMCLDHRDFFARMLGIAVLIDLGGSRQHQQTYSVCVCVCVCVCACVCVCVRCGGGSLSFRSVVWLFG